MKALDFETEPPQKVASARLGKTGAALTPFAGCSERPGFYVPQDIARRGRIEVGVARNAICHPYAR
jgi:hypothetical protein